jgi:hypothetical protein
MLKIASRTIGQFATVQTTEQTEAQGSASNRAQTAAANNTPTRAISSENTSQRAGLQQDELMKKSVLNNQLTAQQESYRQKLEQVEKNKEARDESNSASLFGSIFLGPLVGTVVGGPIAGKSDHETKKDDLRSMIEKENEEIKKLEAELAEVYDSNFVATANWFSGRDEGVEFQGESNVNQTTARKLTAKTSFSSDDDD